MGEGAVVPVYVCVCACVLWPRCHTPFQSRIDSLKEREKNVKWAELECLPHTYTPTL